MIKSDIRAVPNHVGVILDGNRRWAKSRGLPSLEGHMQGYKNLRVLVRYALLDLKIPCVSCFVFSNENWNRTEKEVKYLMKLVVKALNEFLDELHKDNIRIVVLGRRERLSNTVLKAVEKTEATTAKNTGGTLAICFNYGGQAEIADAARAIVEAKLPAKAITEELFANYLYHPEVPPVDLLIRTSGEIRLSGFMLWRAAYSELYFVDKHWPDFNKADIDKALVEYARRERRYGR